MPEYDIAMLLSNAFRPDPRVLKEAESLTLMGHQVTIICWDRLVEFPSKEILSSGVKIIRIQDVKSFYGIGLRQLLRIPMFWFVVQHYLREINPHIIHCHDFDTLPAGLWFGLFNRIPVIYDAHEYYAELVKTRLKGIVGWLLHNMINLGEQFGTYLSSAVVTVDETLAKIYHKHNHLVIILGHYPGKSMALQSNPVFTRPTLTLIYAGRLSVDRGILIYANIVRKLHEKGIPTQLILAGVFTPESEKQIFFDYAKDIVGYVNFIGWIPYDRIEQVYHDADIGLAVLLPEPRYVAATPVKLFEYMACGLPVIASSFPSITKIVSEANCGLLIDPLDDLSGTINIIEFWWKDNTLPQSFGESGRQAILSKYNWENQINQLVKLYQEIS